MCKLSNLYVVDLFDNTTSGGIQWNVANSLPQLMNNPCKIVVKQLVSEVEDTTDEIATLIYLRVVHNINIQSGTNYNGFSNSNVLCFFDTFKVRAQTIGPADHYTASTETQCLLYAPNGLPSILNLNRFGKTNTTISPTDSNCDKSSLSWNIRLEITINPDME